MIYIEDDPHHWQPDDGLAPMSGTRVGHEVVDEDVMLIEVQHARQSFRSARRSMTVVHAIGGGASEEVREKCMDWAHKTAGQRPLVSP